MHVTSSPPAKCFAIASVAGGIPHWVTSTVTSHLRTNESSYYEAWAPYIRQISAIASKYQITRGGPIIAVQIENEFVDRDDVGWPGKVEMMVQLREEMIKHGIEVPLTVNDAYMGKNYVNGTGSGDIYGWGHLFAFDAMTDETDK